MEKPHLRYAEFQAMKKSQVDLDPLLRDHPPWPDYSLKSMPADVRAHALARNAEWYEARGLPVPSELPSASSSTQNKSIDQMAQAVVDSCKRFVDRKLAGYEQRLRALEQKNV